METKIFPAGKPKEGEWVLQWRSGTMPAPAFWYYNSEAEAKADEAKLLDMHHRDRGAGHEKG